jgi:hypothetical protein
MSNRYFYDCEFLEGTQTKRFLGIPYGNTKPTIDLISIGIVTEDGRELYLISKGFNLREAWERYDLKPDINQGGMKKVYWIRENVLKPIYNDLANFHIKGYASNKKHYNYTIFNTRFLEFDYKSLKWLIENYGYTNAEIAEKVKEFCTNDPLSIKKAKYYNVQHNPIELYGYYSAYDHVALCWLFGKMLDLPNGFPMYTIDLKQELDKKAEWMMLRASKEWWLNEFKNFRNYPKQTNEHNALADARWNKELHNFIKSL